MYQKMNPRAPEEQTVKLWMRMTELNRE